MLRTIPHLKPKHSAELDVVLLKWMVGGKQLQKNYF